MDNSHELANGEIEELIRRYGITNQKIMPFAPEKNSSIKQENRTVVDLMRTSLQENCQSKCRPTSKSLNVRQTQQINVELKTIIQSGNDEQIHSSEQLDDSKNKNQYEQDRCLRDKDMIH